jgi:preprotein translocase subunit SecE
MIPLLVCIKSGKMNKISTYFRESYKELMEKVTWPSWVQLQQSTVIVLVATLLITVIVWIMDLASSSVLHFTYSLFS